MKNCFHIPLFLLFIIVGVQAFGQCSTCTYQVTSSSNATYNLNSGQTLCIALGATFTGSINLNGGTLCNQGTINTNSVNFNSGVIYNYGTYQSSSLSYGGIFYNYGVLTISNNLNINSGAQLYNYAGATINVSNNFANNSKFFNYSAISVGGNYNANSGSVNLNDGSVAINGNFNLNSSFENNGVMVVAGNMNANGGSSFTNNSNASLSVEGNFTNNSTTTNDGEVAIEGNFTNNGGAVYINNYSTSVLGNFTNNGTVQGDQNSCNQFVVFGGNVTQNSGGSINNNDFCASGVSNNFSSNNGSLNSVTFCSCSNVITPLPIVLKSFTGECGGDGISLEWVTVTELNNAFFTIFQSEDAINWDVIYVTAGAGSSNEELSYSYTTDRTTQQTTYFKLQQTDYDGTSKTFSPIGVSCSSETSDAVSIYPNPAQEAFYLDYTSSTANEKLIIVIVDNFGKTVDSKQLTVKQGKNTLYMERNGLPSGSYFIKVVGSSTAFVKPIILN